MITAGYIQQNLHEVPDFFGLPMDADGGDAGLHTDTYLGASWNKNRFRKRNAFLEAEHYFNDDWKLNAKINGVRYNSVMEFAGLANSSTKFAGVSHESPDLSVNNMQRYDNYDSQLGIDLRLNGKYYLLSRAHDLFIGYSFSREHLTSLNRRVRNSDPYDVYTFAHNIAKPDFEGGDVY